MATLGFSALEKGLLSRAARLASLASGLIVLGCQALLAARFPPPLSLQGEAHLLTFVLLAAGFFAFRPSNWTGLAWPTVALIALPLAFPISRNHLA